MIDPSLLPLNKLVEGHALITSFQRLQIGNRMAGLKMPCHLGFSKQPSM
ncbi:hypothetical protein E1A91_D11G071900v1 [Gossypium mustelinum]|uniref:Uncharacterized protein n=1 Tax=Gossypium mustelinum TaxID=34275 RepID=A0A5D2SNZ4_GOSMU|nr:hypothetical protein E1A91_D11G071900v1 [Gossypium mustelinum]